MIAPNLTKVALAPASAALAIAFVVGACSGSDPTPSPPTPTPPPALSGESRATATVAADVLPEARDTSNSEQEEALSIPEIVKKLIPSVVHIQTEGVRFDNMNRPVPTGGVGTGEIIDERGYILTNNHVVEGARRIIVTLSDGRALEAEIVGRDPTTDLAVIRIDAEDLIPIRFGRSDELQVGDQVLALGHALNLPGGPTLTGGWVSALGRAIDVNPTITMRQLIQTDAAINPGNSGGPLLNGRGEMIGINTAKIQGGEGISFAIALDPARPIIDELIANGRIDRGFLGASGVTVNEALARNFNLPVSEGVGVVSVADGSPADLAGIRVMDIIVEVDGTPVRNTGDLEDILVKYRSGSSVKIDLLRGDERLTVSATLADRPRDS